ncbi:MAG: hypothetical protein ACOC22_04205 [bacterium]
MQEDVSKQENARRTSPDNFYYIMYTYDQESPLGMSIGFLNRDEWAIYLKIKMNQGIFKGKIDDTFEPNIYQPTGKTQEANISFSMGTTFKLFNPLWGYLGGGYGMYTRFDEVNLVDGSSAGWKRNKDETSKTLYPELGLNLKIANSVALNYGVMYHKEIIHQFGVGFLLDTNIN